MLRRWQSRGSRAMGTTNSRASNVAWVYAAARRPAHGCPPSRRSRRRADGLQHNSWATFCAWGDSRCRSRRVRRQQEGLCRRRRHRAVGDRETGGSQAARRRARCGCGCAPRGRDSRHHGRRQLGAAGRPFLGRRWHRRGPGRTASRRSRAAGDGGVGGGRRLRGLRPHVDGANYFVDALVAA